MENKSRNQSALSLAFRWYEGCVRGGWLKERCRSLYGHSNVPERGKKRAEMLQLDWADSELCGVLTKNQEEKTCLEEPEAMC